jgi:RNA polymerase sigma-70 factor (ECF subfamily)
MNDVAVVHRAVAGDRSAQGELAQRSFRRVLAYCQSRVSQMADAEELAQESLIRAMLDLASLDDPGKFDAWLRAIASHVCSDWHRRRHPPIKTDCEPDSHGDDLKSSDADPSDDAAANEERLLLLRRVQELPADYREVITLFYYEDMTYEEMAQWLGVARATVSERLARARSLLRTSMKQVGSCST